MSQCCKMRAIHEKQISDVLRILVNVRAVSQALEQQRERLKLSEST